MRVKYSLATSFMKQYDEYADYNDYSKGMIIDKIEIYDDETEMQQERHLEEQPLEQVEQPLEEQSLQEQSLEQVEQVEQEDNTNVFIVNNEKYQKGDLLPLKVSDIINIARESNICIKNLKDKNKDDLINELLGKKVENAYSTIKQKIDDANMKFLENKKKLEDKEAEKIKREQEKQRRDKEREEQILRRKKADEDKIAKQNEKKKREEFEKTKVLKNYLTNENEEYNTDADNIKKLEANTLYKPYFEMTFSIDEIIRVKIQKKQNECINIFKNLFKYCIYDLNDKDINLSIKQEAEGDFETKYICKAIINGYKTFPYLISNQIFHFLRHKNIVKQLKKIDIDDSNFNFDIYKEDYDLTNFVIKKDEKTNNVYDFDGNEKTLFNINEGDDINNYEKKIKDKIYKATEYYDRKAILYIYHNANKVGELIYNKVNNRKIYKQSKEDFCNNLKNQMSMLITALISTKNHQVVYFKPDIYSLNSRKYAIQPVSYQNIMREIRHTIARDYYIDIDMKNAHFNLLKHLINTRDYIDVNKCKNVLDYAENRQFYIDDVIKNYPKLNNDIVKQVFLSMMYNEDLDKYDYSKCEWFKNFINEFKYLQDSLYEADEFKEHIDNTKKSIEEKEKLNDDTDTDFRKNLKGKVLSRILQEQENKVLECLIKFLDEKGIKYSSLQYDGLQLLLPNKYKDFTNKLTDYQKKLKLDDNLLDEISKYIKDELNINIQFHYKKLDEGIELPDDYNCTYEREYILKDYNETEIAELFISENKNILNIDNETGIRYIKRNNVWTTDKETYKQFTINILKDMKIYVLEGKYNDIIRDYGYNSKMNMNEYERFMKAISKYNLNAKIDKMESIVKNILVRDDYGTDEFSNKLNNSTIGKLCFNDGVYFMKEKIFKKYPVPDVVSTIKLNYDFPKITDENQKMKKFIYDLLFGAYKEEDRDLFEATLKIHARTIGGHFIDKCWTLEYGERNSGKGFIQDCFKYTFGEYVNLMKYDKVCNNQISTDSSKDSYWLNKMRFARWVYVSEIPDNKVVNGTFIKSIASGGDRQNCRRFGSDIDISLVPHFNLTIYCNYFPKIKPRDCFHNCNLIKTHYGFDDNEFKKGNALYKKKIKIDGLDPKEYIKENEAICREAFLFLMLDFYKPEKFERIPKMIEQLEQNNEIYNQNDIVSIINEYFETAEDKPENRLTRNDISNFKKTLYRVGDKKIGIIRDCDILDKLGKFYPYKKQRCKSSGNKPCFCYTGIKIKNEFLKYYIPQNIDENEVVENEVVENEVVENEVVENEVVENEVLETATDTNTDNNIELKHLVPRKKVSNTNT